MKNSNFQSKLVKPHLRANGVFHSVRRKQGSLLGMKTNYLSNMKLQFEDGFDLVFLVP